MKRILTILLVVATMMASFRMAQNPLHHFHLKRKNSVNSNEKAP